MSSYVYLYKDKAGKPRYVGYGKNLIRATSHLAGSHNDALHGFLDAGEFSLEIAGPFENEETGRAVETALISSLKPEFNRSQGETRWRFRPLGVPLQFAERLQMPFMTREELCRGKSSTPETVILVKISDQNFDDGRVGYSPQSLPTDEQILDRIEKWWMLGKYLPQWSASPSQSPAVLLGVSGKPGEQTIIGSILIDQNRWGEAERDGSFISIPTKGPDDLDALGLRGRQISREVGLRFNAFHSRIYVVMKPEAGAGLEIEAVS